MLLKNLIVALLGVFFLANLTFAESPEEKLRKAERDIQELFVRQASGKEWEIALARISRELFDPAVHGQLPSVPDACECTELGIWSVTTTTRGHVAIVWAWIYRVVDGEKWLTPWKFEFVFRNGRWYLKKYS